MLGKHHSQEYVEKMREAMSDHSKNCMTNGKVIWGVTHEHPKGMKGKPQTQHQKEVAKHCGELNKKPVLVTFPDGHVEQYKSEHSFLIEYHTDASWLLKRIHATTPYHVSKSMKTTTREKFLPLEGCLFSFV